MLQECRPEARSSVLTRYRSQLVPMLTRSSGKVAHAVLAGIGLAITYGSPLHAQEVPLHQSPPIATAPAYNTLIQQARSGNTQPALQYLRQRHANTMHPVRQELLDNVSIASWDGLDDELVQLHNKYRNVIAWPADTLGIVAKSWRNLQQWDKAIALYQAALIQAPRDTSLKQGLILTLADAGRTKEALAQAQHLAKQYPDDATIDMVVGYVHARAGNPYDAWFRYDKAYTKAPQQDEVIAGYITAMQRIGLSGPALKLAQQHPQAISAEQLRSLQADAAAELVRFAVLPTRNEAERFALADQALTRYETLLKQWQAIGEPASADIRRARIDRLGALHARHYQQQVIDEYQQLSQQGDTLPAYALRLVASAYLELRQPEKAAEIYQSVLTQTSPDDPDLILSELGLFYAHIEAEDFEQANKVITQANNRDTFVHIPGQPEPVPNADRLDAQLTADMGLLYANDTEQAQAHLESLADRAPFNQQLHTAVADVYRTRLWPRRAESRLKLAEALEPRNPGLMVEQGFTALDLQEWEQARLLSEDTLQRFPEQQDVRRLKRLYDVYQKPELRITASRGLSNDSPVSGDGGYDVDAVLYSPPIHDKWRAFVGLGKSHGDFEEGTFNAYWQRAGVEWRSRDWTAQAEVSANRYGHGTKTGAAVSVAYDLNDHWQFGANAQRLSRNTPLRALGNDINSNEASIYARWRGSERREWTLTATNSRFSDDNHRYTLALDGSERLYTAPHWSADLLLGLETSRNSKNDTPYYNPRSDLSILPALQLTHILHRRYETTWEHRLTLGAGSYTQCHYGTGAITSVSYEHRFRTNDVFEIGLGISTVSRPYDGKRERETRLMLDAVIKF